MSPIQQAAQKENLSTDELDHLHEDDVHAARIVVGLMTGVFTAGLLMYAFICWLVM